MKNFWLAALLLAWLAAGAGSCLAQAPGAALNLPSTEVYGGFVVTSPDYGPQWDTDLFYGFEGAFSKGLSERLWITGSADFVWGNPSIPNVAPAQNPNLPAGVRVQMHVKQFSGTVGPKYYFPMGKLRPWKLRPYVTGQIGYARQSSNGFYAGDHHPPLLIGTHTVESGFTYRIGGGAELQWTRKVYWRIVQWDFQPQPWGRHTPFYQNLGTGIGYRF
jgi:hypothetical protein